MQQDAESEEWNFTHKFDYIHLRFIVTCFNDTKSVIQKAFDNLEPGGWIEFYDVTPDLVRVDDTFSGTAYEQWAQTFGRAGQILGRDFAKATKYPQWCREAGFVEVAEEHFPLPSNPYWPKDPKFKQIGQLQMLNQLALVDSLGKFLAIAGLSKDQITELEAQAKLDIQSPKIHFCMHLYALHLTAL